MEMDCELRHTAPGVHRSKLGDLVVGSDLADSRPLLKLDSETYACSARNQKVPMIEIYSFNEWLAVPSVKPRELVSLEACFGRRAFSEALKIAGDAGLFQACTSVDRMDSMIARERLKPC